MSSYSSDELQSVDVLVSTRNKERALVSARRNIQNGSIPANRILLDVSSPVSYSRYLLFQKAQTPWVVTLDDDVEVEEGWFDLLKSYITPGVVGVEGMINYEGKPRELQRGERSYGCLDAILRTDVFRSWHPSKWVRSWEDYQIGQHALNYGKWVRIPVKGRHPLNLRRSALWGGKGYRDLFGWRSILFMGKLSAGIVRYALKEDYYGMIQNYYTMKGILSK